MKKLNMQTPDLTAGNIAKIAELFPSVITEKEGKDGIVVKAIDFDLLRQALQGELVEGDDERYRLDWPGKRASLLKANTPITKTLRPDRERSVNFDTTQNIFIEGDNFEVLKILQESYLGKIKMIYVDPPYNTGTAMIYNNDYSKSKEGYDEEMGAVDEEGIKMFKNTDSNGRFHSDWLSMMYERLILARDLLTNDGVICVTIDDYEVSTLELILDEIFGGENKLGVIVVESNPRGRTSSKFYATSHEYYLVYGKNGENVDIYNLPLTSDQEDVFKFDDTISEYRLLPLRKSGAASRKNDRPKQFYPIYINPETLHATLDKTSGYDEVFPIDITGTERVWKIGKDKCKLYLGDGTIVVKKNDTEYSLQVKDRIKDGRKAKTVWREAKYDSSAHGASLLLKLFDGKIFDYPKSIYAVKDFLSTIIKNGEDNIVLDFFSGSSTTAHAVMSLNAEDETNHKFIMVQIPEETDEESEARRAGYKKISDIGMERIRRAGRNILEESKEALKERGVPLDIGFRVYKTDTTNMKDVYYHPSELKQESLLGNVDNVKNDRTPEDLLTQVILELGLELSLPVEQKKLNGNTVYCVQGNALVACFDDAIDFAIVDEIAKLEPLKVVFKDASFKKEQDRTNVETRFKRLSPDTVVTVL